jgi:hypothetical protein
MGCLFSWRLAAEQRAKRGTSTRRPSIEAKGGIAPQGSDGAVHGGGSCLRKPTDTVGELGRVEN